MTLVTFQNRTRLQPARIFGTPCNPQYSINGSSLNSTSLSFEPFDIPLAAAVDDNFQIWFGQDFTNCSEENNAGVICVNVHALYSWAVSKMYQSPVREKKNVHVVIAAAAASDDDDDSDKKKKKLDTSQRTFIFKMA